MHLEYIDLHLQLDGVLFQAQNEKHGLRQVSVNQTQKVVFRSRLARWPEIKRDKNVNGGSWDLRVRTSVCMIQVTGARAENDSPQWGAPMGLAVTAVEFYIRLCVSVQGGRLPHYIIHQPFMRLYACIVVCALPCVGVCSDSNALRQNDHTLLPIAPRNLSAPLPFLHQPQRRAVHPHVHQRQLPVGSGAPLHLCLSSPFFPACPHNLRSLRST